MTPVRVPFNIWLRVLFSSQALMTHSFHRALVLLAAPLLLMPAVPASQQPPPLPSGRQLVERHVAAIGGESAFKGIKSMRLRGRFEITGQNITAEFEELAARPDK